MSRSYFDRNQNLQIHGDVNFVSSGRSSQDDQDFLQVTQRVQATNAQSRAFERGFRILCDNTAPSARYGYGHSFTGPQCHPGTRIAVQDCIFNWLDDPQGQIAMWMNGPVGIGKSAIAQTVAHLAAERGQLSSAFFFFRSDETRNSAKHLVPTLAYEMTQEMPHALDSVCQIVATNPLIFSSPLEHQIKGILLQPLCASSDLSLEVHRLIIIDGLDECLDITTQQTIIRSFISSVLSVPTQSTRHKLLIVSRPESHITSAFLDSNIRPHVKHLSLESWNTHDDIRIFLHDKLSEIKETHPLKHYLPDIWPDNDSFRTLQHRSVGSFAYASAVIRYLASHDDNPGRALEELLSLPPHRAVAAFSDLDALYRYILLALDPKIRFTVLKALCLYVYSSQDSISFIAECLSVEKSHLEIALIRVSSLVDLKGGCVTIHHTSFEEFLRDAERSCELYVFSAEVASTVATAISHIWLQPLYDQEKCELLTCMAFSIKDTDINIDMDVHILRVLVATPIATSTVMHDQLWFPPDPICKNFQAIQWRSIQGSSSTHGPLYSQAFNAVCALLRSQLNLIFQRVTTLNDVLDIITPGSLSTRNPAFIILRGLALVDAKPFDLLCRLFPELDLLELCSGILETYLALNPSARLSDMYNRHDETPDRTTSLNWFFCNVLGLKEAMIPRFCQRLEEIILGGQKALDYFTSPYPTSTSKHHIFHFFYVNSYSDAKLRPHITNRSTSGNLGRLWGLGALVEKTDNFIRQVHAKKDFAYISEEVKALYTSDLEEL